VGPELQLDKLVRLDLAPARADEHGLHGSVIATDGPFGNLVTNIDGDEFLKLGYQHGEKVQVTIGRSSVKLPFVRTFSDVPLHEPLIYIDSRGRVGLAVNQGSFASVYKIKPPVTLDFARK
jgi:S-adenosylmethionine hydrolase